MEDEHSLTERPRLRAENPTLNLMISDARKTAQLRSDNMKDTVQRALELDILHLQRNAFLILARVFLGRLSEPERTLQQCRIHLGEAWSPPGLNATPLHDDQRDNQRRSENSGLLGFNHDHSLRLRRSPTRVPLSWLEEWHRMPTP
jgi:hypothetical protein